MTGSDAIAIINLILKQQHQGILKTLEAEIVTQVWEDKSYKAIGRELGYDPEYIKKVAARLWKLLSEVVGEKVSRGNIHSILEHYHPASTSVDWGEAIPDSGGYVNDVAHFYGRSIEIETLSHWLVDCRCRLVGIFGWGGIGKTALSVKVAQSLEAQFEYVVWRSVRHAPSLRNLLAEILPILGAQIQESSLDGLMRQLRQQRCLLVLDNVESILRSGEARCSYLRGYEDYGELFDRVSDEVHQSCLVLTGREKPNGIERREGVNLPVRSLCLQGLTPSDAQQILTDKGLAWIIHEE